MEQYGNVCRVFPRLDVVALFGGFSGVGGYPPVASSGAVAAEVDDVRAVPPAAR